MSGDLPPVYGRSNARLFLSFCNLAKGRIKESNSSGWSGEAVGTLCCWKDSRDTYAICLAEDSRCFCRQVRKIEKHSWRPLPLTLIQSCSGGDFFLGHLSSSLGALARAASC